MIDFSRYDSFIFDWDNTLAATEPLHIKAIEKALQEMLQYQMNYDDCLFFVGSTSAALAERILHKLDRDDVSAEQVSQRKADILRKQDIHFKLFPGVQEFLHFWKGRKKLALASNSSREFIERSLAYSGLRKYFDCIICADDVEKRKPEPEMFLLAATQLASDRNRCLIFEDSTAGLLAAQNAAMPAVLVLNPGNPLPGVLELSQPMYSWPQLLQASKGSCKN
ncbi:MAG: HAD family phosphatase [Oligosphaeraceae bacterium]|mgnify:FL=1|nr:HAD family phosphatase [Oligosphaeraceae bacterium]